MLRAARDGNEAAREELVEAFTPLIASMARRYRNARRVDRGELMQEGVVGLLRALERYDPEVGPFWPYASWWVRQAMQRLVCTCAPVHDYTGRQVARVGLSLHAVDDRMFAHDQTAVAMDLARRISVRLGYLPAASVA